MAKVTDLADEPGIVPLRVSSFEVGYTEEIHGKGGEEIPEFVPTRHELIQLVRFWARQVAKTRWFMIMNNSVGSCDRREIAFAWARIDQIADYIDPNALSDAVTAVYEEFGKDKNPHLWKYFCTGDVEALNAYEEALEANNQEPEKDA